MPKRVTARCVAPPFRFGTGAAFGVCAVSRNLLFSGHSPANRPVTVFVSRSQILAEFRKKVPRILALFDAFRKAIFSRKKKQEHCSERTGFLARLER